VQELARQLDPQQALLMLLPTVDAVYVWAVASDRPAAFVRAKLNQNQVNTLVARLRSQLDFASGMAIGSRFDHAAAFELYNALLAPLSAAWQGKTQWVVAAGGSLSQLPFGLLQTRASATSSASSSSSIKVSDQVFDANTPWLIRDVSITQVPSLSAWLAIKSIGGVKAGNEALMAWGDPVFHAPTAAVAAPSAPGGAVQARSIALSRSATLANLDSGPVAYAPAALRYGDIPTLPETRDELLAIAAILKANPANDVILGGRATRDSVLAASKAGLLANKRVVAFATHGLMAGDLPNLHQPALAMAATGAEAANPLAPLLTLEDVLTLKLNADWVVLSACNTAAADGRAEEALSGLARGFFYAGGRSLLVTHWAVESDSAKELTTATFAHYTANPQAPKAESLRQAMLKVMANPKFSHPAFWAPYALVGDGGR
jgi:CHAT domain-containing protein